MRFELTETLWLDQRQELSLAELADLSGLTESELRQLIEYDALVPIRGATQELMFTADCIVTARTACRLRNDFDLEPAALSLVLTLLERIRKLEAQLGRAEAERPRRFR
jgi:chaperone modulatory protein CbpM